MEMLHKLNALEFGKQLLWGILVCLVGGGSCANAAQTELQVEVSVPDSIKQPITGRMLLMFSREKEPEVRFQVGWYNSPPVFGIDVDQAGAGRVVVFDDSVPGFPIRRLKELPKGDYYVQALLNVYTKFNRADGHEVWAHMDQGEGQSFSQSPGNLYSPAQRIHLDPSRGGKITLKLSETIAPRELPADTEWVKRVRIQSKILSKFWGRPMYVGATILLPRGYTTHPGVRYPVIYQHDHFSLAPPFNFTTEMPNETEKRRRLRQSFGLETGYEFFQAWSSDDFPRVIAVTLQHPTPFYDTSYAVNSANNGPYEDAIMRELIPYIEDEFRAIRQPHARVMTGRSTGGWISLSLLLRHPDFFGGAWSFYPDPVDFRRYQLVNIYEDENAFVSNLAGVPDWLRQDWVPIERTFQRSDEGQPVITVRQAGQLEAVWASKGRSGGVLDNWDVLYGPVGDDGYPTHLWDKHTGKIDRRVAEYMRDNGYDLRQFAETNWSKIGPQLSGKLHVYCGDSDNFFLNLSVYLFQAFLESKDPSYKAAFSYGRPLRGHGWQPVTNSVLVKEMALHVSQSTPKDGSRDWTRDATTWSEGASGMR